MIESEDFSLPHFQDMPESQAIFRFLRSLSAHYQKIQRQLTNAEAKAFRALTAKGAIEGIMRCEWTNAHNMNQIKFWYVTGDYVQAWPNADAGGVQNEPSEIGVVQARLTTRGESWASILRNGADNSIRAQAQVLRAIVNTAIQKGTAQVVKGPVENEPSELIVPLPAKTEIPNSPQSMPIHDAPKVPKYEKDAYLSYIRAIQECPSLDTPRKVYDWIKQNGVEIDGRSYAPPTFDTWRKYRSEGERKAK